MFEITQILWWLIQATILGYIVTRKTINDTTNQILFAPLFGFSIVALVGNGLWMWGFPTLFPRYFFVALLLISLLYLFKNIRAIKNKGFLLSTLGCVFLLCIQSIFIPYSEKVFLCLKRNNLYFLFQKEYSLTCKKNLSRGYA